MAKRIFISSEELLPALARLAERTELWVPATTEGQGGAIRFRRYRAGIIPVFDRLTRMSPKEVLQPQVESLFSFQYAKDPENSAQLGLTLDDATETSARLVFGARPCDARAFALTDLVFKDGRYADGLYGARRENTLIATLVCQEGDSACFCSAVGGGPADVQGSDMEIVPVEGGLVVRALQDRALSLVDGLGTTATETVEAAAERVIAEVSRQVVGNLDTGVSVEDFRARFADMEYWRDVAERCLSCGICTFVCPTCYCFNISDEIRDLRGERLRSWDSCMFCRYTLEASGHNPRPTKLERYRNRVGHKFAYFPEQHQGKFSCTGCGRCIRLCPVSIDIRGAVAGLKENVCVCE